MPTDRTTPVKTFRKSRIKKTERIDSVVAEELANFLYVCGQKFLIERRNASDAFECYSRSLWIRPKHPGSLHNIGVLLAQVGDYKQAAEAFEEEMNVRQTPAKDAAACSAFVECARKCGRVDDALRIIERIKDEDPFAYCLLKSVLANELGDLDEAERFIDQALTSNPGDNQCLLNKALLRMSKGDWAAWAGEYERFLSYGDHNTRMREFRGRTPWDGLSSLEGKTLLVVSDQGHGDAFQFVRFFAELKKKFNPDKITFYCQRAVQDVCSTASAVDDLIGFGDVEDVHSHYDEFTSLLGLLRILHVSPDTCDDRPYLKTDIYLETSWGHTLEIAEGMSSYGPDLPDSPRIALVWRGDHKHGNDHNRSMPLKKMMKVLPKDRVLYSLQMGKGRAEADEFPEIIDLMSRVRDFSDTAAMLRCMDAVVTVDTAVAHLAGAIDVPCVTLLPNPSEWRWLLEGDRTPWYERMRLARQDRPRDWTSAVAKAKKYLGDILR